MKYRLYFLLFVPFFGFAQEPIKQDTPINAEMDSISRMHVELEEVIVLSKLKFADKEQRLKYLVLQRRTHKVYPYAKLASEQLTVLNERLASFDKKSDQRKYMRIVQNYVEEEFSAELKKLTKSEGQILVKLIHRQTGKTTFTLIKELKSGWRAFWFNNTAKLFDISLKREFDPYNVAEDYLIESILQRAFINGQLERQNPAFKIDMAELYEKWRGGSVAKE